ncbi:DUF1329 domain-containing protein [Endozoicomonas sp. OPT23]|uniref:DUF1329 domain-containing protein n=1 Tax=Endozoicomonas sp. OPT23 TaxID=2072845 RepID=UPI00129C08A6|nr:DUF1329 domain-containing protein [Endozoicomonas sp. OPT23]MRI33828.1 DUF1329 domain-containing protein [Endozoicomonas sp. OPT23]
MIIRKSLLAMGFVGAVFAATGVSAKVSPEEAARLGKDLTPVGAERAGNAEGTIPAWNPDFKVPESYKGTGHHYPDPYADEKPLLTITKDNLDQYRDKLSPGQQKMFETYPDTFKMNIYPSHRNGSYSEFTVKNTRLNALEATLAEGGNGVVGAWGGVPFPIPEKGEEAIWNLTQAGGARYSITVNDQVHVLRDGTHSEARVVSERFSPYFDHQSSREEFKSENGMKLLMLIQNQKPARDKGKATLIHLPLNTAERPRSAWVYSPGVRRVRRAPTVGYDNFEAHGKITTVDSGSGFNGATDRYDWTLVGKKEMYIPYNGYRMQNPEVSFKELLPAGHVNPEHMRYELHRVWVVEANLKEGQRNVFKKRVLFIDEDSWISSVVDMYDNRDNLWQVSMFNSLYAYDLPGISGSGLIYHDLLSQQYFAEGLTGRAGPGTLNVDSKEIAHFKPASLRKLGVR